MQKFKGSRSIAEISKLLVKTYGEGKLKDDGKSDWVNGLFYVPTGKVKDPFGYIFINIINKSFIIYDGEMNVVTRSHEIEYENEEWFIELLNIIYIS